MLSYSKETFAFSLINSSDDLETLCKHEFHQDRLERPSKMWQRQWEVCEKGLMSARDPVGNVGE
jgi:hypothetical protein